MRDDQITTLDKTITDADGLQVGELAGFPQLAHGARWLRNDAGQIMLDATKLKTPLVDKDGNLLLRDSAGKVMQLAVVGDGTPDNGWRLQISQLAAIVLFFALSLSAAFAQSVSTVTVESSGKIAYPKNFLAANGIRGHRAVIHIALPTVFTGQRITDFELKAAVSGDWENKVLYYHSSDPTNALTNQVWGKRPTVFFTRSGTGVLDCREWVKQTAEKGIWEDTRLPATATVTGFVVIIEDDLSQYKDKLQWSYSLMVAGQYIKYPLNTGVTAWFPTVPVAWETDNYNPEKP